MNVDHEASVTFNVKSDNSAVTLIIPGDFDPGHLDRALLVYLARERGIFIDAAIRDRLEEIAQTYCAKPQRLEQTFATSTPAINGDDGYVQWVDDFNPQTQPSEENTEGTNAVNHYSGVTYLSVSKGINIARVYAPTDGEDGMDVKGGVLKAKPGKAAEITIGDGLVLDSTGHLVSQIDGVFTFERGVVHISPLLEISGAIDFSSGNIDFNGTVIVREGICPRFKVKASEDIVVEGLIESAHIECGGTFQCRQGMTGQESGTLLVHGDAHVKYLNALTGIVHGNLYVENELLGCKLRVDGDLSSDSGTIIGGEVTVAGSICVATFGSAAELPTVIILGEVPKLEVGLKEELQLQKEMNDELQRLQDRGKTLELTPAKNLSADEKEEITMLSFEVSEMVSKIDESIEKQRLLQEELAQSRKVHVEIMKAIYPKVVLKVRDQVVQFDQIVKGPLVIGWGADKQLQFRCGNGPARPLADVARLIAKAA